MKWLTKLRHQIRCVTRYGLTTSDTALMGFAVLPLSYVHKDEFGTPVAYAMTLQIGMYKRSFLYTAAQFQVLADGINQTNGKHEMRAS